MTGEGEEIAREDPYTDCRKASMSVASTTFASSA